MALEANPQSNGKGSLKQVLALVSPIVKFMRLRRASNLNLPIRRLSDAPAQSLHWSMPLQFTPFHLWAGEFRKMGETVRSDHGIVGHEAHRIVPELGRIALETKQGLDEVTNSQDKAIACFHMCYRRDHPLLDGNSPTSAVLLEGQLQALFPLKNCRVHEPKENYKLKLARIPLTICLSNFEIEMNFMVPEQRSLGVSAGMLGNHE